MEVTRILEDNYLEMLRLLLSENPTQEALDDFLGTFSNMEKGNEDFVLLSNFWVNHGDLTWPDEYLLELDDIRSFYLFSTACLLGHFETICSQLLLSGIDFVLLKGVAMLSLGSVYTRIMGDTDVLVREKDFSKSLKVARRLGYSCCVEVHSADITAAGGDTSVIDIHRLILVVSGKGRAVSDGIFSRAQGTVFSGINCMIPCISDLLFISVTNLSRNLMDCTRQTKILSELIDIRNLISKGPEWDIFIENCKKTESEDEVSFIVSIVNGLIPGLFPEFLETLASEREKKLFSKLFVFRREILFPLKLRRSSLRLWNVARDPRKFFQFIIFRPLYLFLKLFKYSPRMAAAVMAVVGPFKHSN